jgi:hypothetical protein
VRKESADIWRIIYDENGYLFHYAFGVRHEDVRRSEVVGNAP